MSQNHLFNDGFCCGPLFNQPIVRTPKHKMFRHGWGRRADDMCRATPPWITQKHANQIKKKYQKAAKLTKSTGVRHSVDHIVPLNHPLVCGLHVPWNLEVITFADNQAKSNLFWPDMWAAQGELLNE